MSISVIKEEQLKKERYAEKLGLKLENINKSNNKKRFVNFLENKKFIFIKLVLSLVFVASALIMSIYALSIYYKETKINLYSTSYTSDITSLNILRFRDGGENYIVEYVMGDNIKVLTINKRVIR